MLRVLITLVCFFVAVYAQYLNLHEQSFDIIKNTHQQQFVVFYYSSHADHKEKLTQIDAAAGVLKSEYPAFKFLICDGDAEVNKKEFTDGGFQSGGFYMFTQLNEQGIQKYAHGAQKDDLVTHIRDLFSSYDNKDVIDYTTESAFFELLDTEDTPIVVKFYEQWCTHCKAFKKPFHVAATKLSGKARFVEVECSRNDHTKAFCNKYEARAFPVVMIFDSERKAKFDYDSRSVIYIRDFVSKFTSGAIGEENTALGASSIEATISNTGGVKIEHNTNASTLDKTPNQPNLGTEAGLADRVASLERTIEALLARLEKVEKK